MTWVHDDIITEKEIELFKLVLNPSPEVARKVSLVKRLLKESKPLYKAIREAGLGWKNYYKYAPLIYDDPEILVPLPKIILKEYIYRQIDVKSIRAVLDCVTKHACSQVHKEYLSGEKGERGDSTGG
jgi:ACT domain-containing protein